MKTLKSSVTFICLLVGVHKLGAQDVKVNVVSGEERLAYAYVSVNGHVVGVTDTLGIFNVPRFQLQRGDTLSASFVRFDGRNVIYDGDPSRELIIDLKANFELEAVTVSAQKINMLRQLRRHTNFPQYINTRDKEYDISFESAITDGGIEHNAGGAVKLVLSPRLDLDRRYKCLSLDARGDTTEVVQLIGETMMQTVWLAQSLSFAEQYKNTVITSRGIVDNKRIFILSYTYEAGTMQILLHVDKENKNIRSFEISLLSSDLVNRTNMHANLRPYGRNKVIELIDYEWRNSRPSIGRSVKIEVNRITESPHSNTRNLFYDSDGNPK